MALNLNLTDIVGGKVKLGSNNVTAGYLGSTQVFISEVPGEVYTTTFSDLSDWTLDESAGNVTLEAPIGTLTPQVSNAITFTHTSAGQVNASLDLGVDYDELYIQYYTTVINSSTANNYANNLEVGSAIAANETGQIFMRHDNPTDISIYGEGAAFGDTGFKTYYGVWNKIGIYINRLTQEYTVYVNGKEKVTKAATTQVMRYLTMGGTGGGSSSYKFQIAALSINTLGFQDIITNTNGVGNYTSHFVDYSMETNTNYNGVDLSVLDKSGWTGLHPEPFDPDGGTNYIDGPISYFNHIGTNSEGKLKYADRFGDKWFYKRGVTYYMDALTRPHSIQFSGTEPNANEHPYIEAYGTGALPIVKSSILVSSGWTLHDAANNIWKQTITNIDNCTGVFIEGEERALRQSFNLPNMANYVGVWYEDGTDLYVRLWDEADPNTKDLNVSSNQRPAFNDFTEIKDIQFRHGGLLVSNGVLVEDCEFTRGSGVNVTNGIVRFSRFFNNWTGVDYGNTQATAVEADGVTQNSALGLGGSGGGGIGVNEGAKVYGCTVEDQYLGCVIDSDAYDAVVAFNSFKNIITNTISIAGTGDGDPARPTIIANNTVFCGGRHIDNDPYPIVRPQPNHGFVHQNGGYGNFQFFNNLMLLHYNENTGFSLRDNNSTTNIMSFVTNAYENAIGKLGYNKYYITPTSNSPAVIFNGGAGNTIATWRTNMALEAFTDLDGTSDPDTTSTVETTLPVTTATYTDSSGKWLSTDPTPITTGDGYTGFDFAALGITKKADGSDIDPLNMNIGAY